MIRRLADIGAALAALVVLSPLLVVIALAVIWDSPGGPLYLGWRSGKNGRRFRMWKFRTMERGSASQGTITGGNDRRITRIGRILRRTKLDELPQFVNVLLGDMTLVGPRPEEPAIVALYTTAQRRVLEVRPGITGRVQLESGREEDTIPEGVPADQYYVENLMDRKLRRDIEYLETRTAWTDVQVVLATAGFVLRSLMDRPIRRTLTSGAGHEH